jgi:hypothetical protein
MNKQRILRSAIAAAAIAAAPMVFASAASAQSHGHGGGSSHGSGQSHGGGGWNGGHGGGPSHGSSQGSNQASSQGWSHGSGGPSHGAWNGGHSYDRGHGRDVVIVNRGPRYAYNYRRPYYYGPSLALGFGLGYNYGAYNYGAYDSYYDTEYDSYNLYPGECRTDYRWDAWSGRPAEIAVRICADSYGRTYVVRDSRRWVRWR